MTAGATPPLACSTCSRRDAPNYFKVTRVTNGHVETPLTTVCSLPCLMKWCYGFAAMQSARMVYGLREMWNKLTGGR